MPMVFKRRKTLAPGGFEGVRAGHETGLQIAPVRGGMVDCTPEAISVIDPVLSHSVLHIWAGHTGREPGSGAASGGSDPGRWE